MNALARCNSNVLKKYGTFKHYPSLEAEVWCEPFVTFKRLIRSGTFRGTFSESLN